jgi:Resolvase, N terminal domain
MVPYHSWVVLDTDLCWCRSGSAKAVLVVVVRRVWGSKAELLAGGVEVEALAYQRASADKKQQGKSVGDQAKLNRREVAGQGWRLGASYTDNDRSASRYAKQSRPDYKRLIEDITAGRGDVLVLWEIARGSGIWRCMWRSVICVCGWACGSGWSAARCTT